MNEKKNVENSQNVNPESIENEKNNTNEETLLNKQTNQDNAKKEELKEVLKTEENENEKEKVNAEEQQETIAEDKADIQNTKKATAADLIIQKIKQRDIEKRSSLEKIQELRKIHEEIQTKAEPDTVEEEIKKEDKIHTNYNEFSREELVAKFEELIKKPIEEIIDDAELIKNTFYKKRNAEILEKRNSFIEEGGKKEDFKIDPDNADNNFKILYDKFKELKHQRAERIQTEKQRNLEQKNSIIIKIEELIEKGETLNKTFDEFHKLRDEWEKIGAVPQSEVKSLLEKYNFTLQKFYDWVKINKELRDFDLKRNLDLKTKLCEEAETLILEPKVTKAYQKLQKLHEKWKEIGPVANEIREEIWARFKEASSIINKKHYNYFQQIKQQQADNLKAKELLCDEAEKIAKETYERSVEWQEKTEEINELMKLWKLIGFAPKKYNNHIFERFINARKNFFENKHNFFQNYADIMETNLKEKEQLLIEAENAKDQTDWRKTTEFFVNLQNRWKSIGPVPKAQKDEIWHKFNTACNTFFENKREYFKNRKAIEEENLKQKQELINNIKNLNPEENPEENLKKIQEIQRQWSQIGFVPLKQKDKIYKEYKNAITEKLKSLDIDPQKRAAFENKSRIDTLLKSENAGGKIRYEIEKTKNKIAEIHNEIITLENNISFFVKSKNTEEIINNFNKKIEKLKQKKVNSEKTLLSLIKAMKESDKKQ